MPHPIKQAPTDFSWKPPESPDSKLYKELLGFIGGLKASGKPEDMTRGMAWFRAVAEVDFWFWQRYVMSLGALKIKDRGHKRFGHLWVMEPWFFDRMREVQEIFDCHRSPALIQWARGLFKSSAVQKGGILWFLGKDPTTTHSLTTQKETKTGVRFGKDLMAEINYNDTLQAHWPQFRDCPEMSANQVTVHRPPGIREASFALYGILSSAASGHFTHQWGDDIVDPEERSPIVHAEIENRLSLAAFTGSDDTMRVFIGVPSCDLDAVEKLKKQGNFFHPKALSVHPGILPGGIYPMRSKAFYDKMKRETRQDHFASQVLLEIVPPGSRYFRREWVRRYNMTPEQAARGARIHILVDPAEGKRDASKKKLSDFLVIRVYAFTHDRRRRALDIWRERIGLADALDLLFGPLPDEEDPDGAMEWKRIYCGPTGLVGKWRPYDPNLTVWIENVGASQFDATLRREMKQRRKASILSPTCNIRELRSNVQKERRIANMQPDYRAGIFEYPAHGFGHGSFATLDARDTLDQYLDDEFAQWTLKGETLYDDMIDLEAWTSQPNTSFPYPDVSESDPEVNFMSAESSRAMASQRVASGPFVSWRVS